MLSREHFLVDWYRLINIAVRTDIARSKRLAVAVGKEWMWSDSDQRRTGLADGPRSKRGSSYSPWMVRRRFSWLGLICC